MITEINELAERAYRCAVRRGKTIEKGNISHKDTVASLADEFSEFVIANERLKSEHIEFVSQAAEELADILIVCMTELHRRNVDVEKLLLTKMEFNDKRI